MAASRKPVRRPAARRRASRSSRPVVARDAPAVAAPWGHVASGRDPRAIAASTTYVWRRLHDGSLIAEASPVRGMGSWRVCAYPTANNGEAVHEQQAFSLLRDAHAAADDLVRRHFRHTCRTGVCGRWLRWAED